MNWIKNKMRGWLGIFQLDEDIAALNMDIKILNQRTYDLVNIGVDVHFREPHMILIYSKLNGGQLRHIDAKFETLAELNHLVKELKSRYNTSKTTWDMPINSKRFVDGGGY